MNVRNDTEFNHRTTNLVSEVHSLVAKFSTFLISSNFQDYLCPKLQGLGFLFLIFFLCRANNM